MAFDFVGRAAERDAKAAEDLRADEVAQQQRIDTAVSLEKAFRDYAHQHIKKDRLTATLLGRTVKFHLYAREAAVTVLTATTFSVKFSDFDPKPGHGSGGTGTKKADSEDALVDMLSAWAVGD